MRYIDRVIVRELAANKSRTAVLLLALSVAFLMPAGIEMGLRSLLQTRNSFATALDLADLEIRLLPEDVRNLPDWTNIPGLARVEERLLLPGVIQPVSGPPVNALMVFLRQPRPSINRLQLREGRELPGGASADAVVERSAREFHGVGVGQELEVQVGKQTYRQHVVGVAASPEFLLVAANPEYFLPSKGSLVVVYTSLERVYENIGFRMVNDLIFKFAPGADGAATKAAILAGLGSRQIERVIPRDEHISWKHLTLDNNVFRIFQPAIALVLAVLAAALVMVNFDRLVRRQHAELGAIKAMGYSGGALVRAYVYAALWLSLAGIGLGALGAVLFRSAFLMIYADAHGLAYLEHHLYWAVLLQSAATVAGIAVGSALLATWRLWRIDPIVLMRPLLATGRQRNWRPWSLPERWPMPIRLAVRNLVRTPRLTAISVIGVALTVSVGAAYLICLDSMEQAIVRSVQSQPWTSAVSFLYPVVDEDYQSALAGFSGERVEGFVRAPAILANANESIDVSVLGLKADGSLQTLNIVSGRMAQAAAEIVIGADLGRRLGVSTGGQLELRIRNQRRAVVVSGIKSDVVMSEAVMSLSALQGLLELEDQATGMFVAVSAGTEPSAVAARLQQLDFVSRVTGRATLITEFTTLLQDIRKIVLLVAGITLLVAIVFITANVGMAVAEQATEFSTMWALGYDRFAAARVVLVNAGVQTVLGLLLAVPLTAALAVFLNRLASRAWFDQTTYVSPAVPLGVIAGVMVLTVVGTRVSFERFWRSDLLENLRTRSIQ